MEEQKTEFRNGKVYFYDGFAWRFAKLTLCKKCGLAWYIREEKPLIHLCKKCRVSGEKNPMFGKISPNRGKTIHPEGKKRFVRLLAQKNRANAIKEREGKCQICGIADIPISAFDFHHLNPNTKEGHLHNLFANINPKKLQEELIKCILLCANCHRGIHHGFESIEDYT